MAEFFEFLRLMIWIGIGICGVILIAAAIVFLLLVLVISVKNTILKEWGKPHGDD